MKPIFTDKHLLSYQQRLNRLRCFTLLFFTLLFVPSSIVFYQGFMQYKKEQINQYQNQTEKVTTLVNKRLFKRTALAAAIPVTEFDYYQTLYNPISKEVSKALSPLSTKKSFEPFKGHMGYFQIDQQGKFNSPVWPYNIDDRQGSDIDNTLDTELKTRRNIATKLFDIISQSTEIKSLIGQKEANKNNKFRLISDVPEYYIFHRSVTVVDQVKLQGFVFKRDVYLNNLMLDVLKLSTFDATTAITIQPALPNADNLNFLVNVEALKPVQISQPTIISPVFTQQLVNSERVSWPYSNYVISYATSPMQLTTAAIYGICLMSALLVAIALGCYGFYYLGQRQLKLAEQRLNFVSSVSHELKTPLTSIRMYAEMLKSGMVLSPEHQTDYYEFIHSESERLSRLIDNILQLSALSQPQHSVDPQYTKLSILIDIIHSKISSQINNSGFELNLQHNIAQPEEALLLVDVDAFSQVIINVTDNAIKFFDEEKIKDSSRKKIDFIFSQDPENNAFIQLEIRDYGIGINPEQEDKIFELFYRGGSELTRSTQGTGIGLALVNELVIAQHATITVQRMKPGLAIKISFKSKKN